MQNPFETKTHTKVSRTLSLDALADTTAWTKIMQVVQHPTHSTAPNGTGQFHCLRPHFHSVVSSNHVIIDNEVLTVPDRGTNKKKRIQPREAVWSMTSWRHEKKQKRGTLTLLPPPCSGPAPAHPAGPGCVTVPGVTSVPHSQSRPMLSSVTSANTCYKASLWWPRTIAVQGQRMVAMPECRGVILRLEWHTADRLLLANLLRDRVVLWPGHS